MESKAPKLDVLLSHRPIGRVLEVGKIGEEFERIREAFGAADKRVPEAADFKRVGCGSGTHLLKLVTPRAPTGQSVVRTNKEDANRHPALFPSIDAKLALVAKLVFRPLEVTGHPPKSLADHILNPNELSPEVTRGFADAFGRDALHALCQALTTPLPMVESLPAAEFPIIFLPRPGGGDLQATPLAPAEAYVRFDEVTEPYFRKSEEGQPRVPRGSWHRQFVADKPQNISSAVGKQRTRFFAEMPRVHDSWCAELYRYACGGSFPRWRDGEVSDAITAYATLLDIDHSNLDIRAGRDRRANALISAARDFIDETVADARIEHPGFELSDPPPVTTVLLSRHWSQDGFELARRTLTSGHFKGRLQVQGEA